MPPEDYDLNSQAQSYTITINSEKEENSTITAEGPTNFASADSNSSGALQHVLTEKDIAEALQSPLSVAGYIGDLTNIYDPSGQITGQISPLPSSPYRDNYGFYYYPDGYPKSTEEMASLNNIKKFIEDKLAEINTKMEDLAERMKKEKDLVNNYNNTFQYFVGADLAYNEILKKIEKELQNE